MKSIFIALFFVMVFSFNPAKAQEQTVPFTLADRDRIIRMETKMDAQFNSVDVRLNSLDVRLNSLQNSLQKQIDQLSTLFFWGFGILVSLFLFNLGYTIWDRRTAIRPALDKAESADLKSTGLLRVLRDYAKDHPDFADILKYHGFL